MTRRILVTGATGYIGGRLVPQLLATGAEVTCLVRDGSSLQRPFRDAVTVARGSADDVAAVERAAAGCDVAYYLIHSLGGGDFEQKDRELAEAFRKGCEAAGVGRIIYLGGLGNEDDDLSPHLRSRQEVGRVLADGPTPVTELRAAIIIGSGSASFEMLRSLTEILPVMTTPSWVNDTRCQPTAIQDVLTALIASLDRTAEGHDVLELGGPDIVTYREMMNTYARVAGLRKRWILGLRVLTPRLSSHWVSLVTPLPSTLAKQLVGSLMNDVVVVKNPAVEAFGMQPAGFEEAVADALRMVEDLVIPTRWSADSDPELAAIPDPDDPEWAGGQVCEDVRRQTSTTAQPRDVFRVVTGLGGDTGWLWGNWLWRVRGVMDSAIGGSGLSRGRRHPHELVIGDTVDFWRVVRIDEDRFLRLRADMLLPGWAWLEWAIEPDDHGGTTMVQRARFVPKGLAGRAYWYSLWPVHQILFPRMAARIMAQAERH